MFTFRFHLRLEQEAADLWISHIDQLAWQSRVWPLVGQSIGFFGQVSEHTYCWTLTLARGYWVADNNREHLAYRYGQWGYIGKQITECATQTATRKLYVRDPHWSPCVGP